MQAPQILTEAAAIMAERGKQYDKPDGERSMAQTVAAFNAITGGTLRESDGWLLLALLKMVRDNQRQAPHADSCLDLVAYAGLYAESRLSDIIQPFPDITEHIHAAEEIRQQKGRV